MDSQDVQCSFKHLAFNSNPVIHDCVHSLVSQVTPLKSRAHSHVNELTPSLHVPPLRQGNEAQSSILISHISPVYPSSQLHTNVPTPFVQLPPLEHGLGSQKSIECDINYSVHIS